MYILNILIYKLNITFTNLAFKIGIQISVGRCRSWHVFFPTKRFGCCTRKICIPTSAFSITAPVCIRTAVSILATLSKDIKVLN